MKKEERRRAKRQRREDEIFRDHKYRYHKLLRTLRLEGLGNWELDRMFEPEIRLHKESEEANFESNSFFLLRSQVHPTPSFILDPIENSAR